MPLMSSCLGFGHAVRTDDPAVLSPCKYGAQCESGHSLQFTTGLWRQYGDTLTGRGMAALWIDHLGSPVSLPGIPKGSTLELESRDSSVALDVSSVRIVHRTESGRPLTPTGVFVDTTVTCSSCSTRNVRIRVMQFYGTQRIPRRLVEEVSADLIVRGERVPVRVVFRDVRRRLQWTFIDVLMGV